MTCQYQKHNEKPQDVLFPSTKNKVPVVHNSLYVSPPIPAEPRGYQKGKKFGCFRQYGIIQTESSEYQLLHSYGKGAFGQVILGWNLHKKEYVAIKVLVNRRNIEIEARREIYFLKKIREGNGCQFNLLKYQCSFICRDQHCLVMEPLDQTLLTYMERRDFEPLSLTEIRPILKQIYLGLAKLEELHIIHTDIKPENIMFVNTRHSPHKIKLVDFGNAISADETHLYNTLQTLYYRAPEIILGNPYGHAIDVWSVGCTVAELYLGCILYEGYTAYDQIRAMCDVQGFPEAECLRTGSFTGKYFNKQPDYSWVLKTRDEFVFDTKDFSRCKPRNLGELLYKGSTIEACEYSSAVVDRHAFIDLLIQMLSLNQFNRVRPINALQHPFIRMIGLDEYNDCEYVKTSINIMRLL